jgi:hypothetical protein
MYGVKMNDIDRKKIVIEKLVASLELPDDAYDKAIARYEDIGEWMNRDESTIKDLDAHIFTQGSFRLGTAIRPLSGEDEYDLDLTCKIRSGISKETHSQLQLKNLVGSELELYRRSRGIKEPLSDKHRCWRLEYRDSMSFHIDIVPCIPESAASRQILFDSLTKSGADAEFSKSATDSTVSITDNRDPNYKILSMDWNISNPEGYALWFENAMKRKQNFDLLEKAAQVDKVPLYKRKSSLQKVIQLLKRHRDMMFKGQEDSKPISIIITTLSTLAYNGESNLYEALSNILNKMGTLVNPSTPRVPNPVDPGEDFADKWEMSKYKHLKLEENFWLWLQQAKNDLDILSDAKDPGYISKQASAKFGLRIDESDLAKSLGINSTTNLRSTPKKHDVEGNLNKPWAVK